MFPGANKDQVFLDNLMGEVLGKRWKKNGNTPKKHEAKTAGKKIIMLLEALETKKERFSH